MLKNKNILIGVSGSIAVYKSIELIRLYIKAGANVKVIMTEASKKFINPLTFETISQSKVLDDSNECWDKESFYNHIAIGKWADIFVIAPASANTINKLANGIADNILTQAVLAFSKSIILCPAANTNMMLNKITSKSLKKLKSNDFLIVEPISKELACRDVGVGALSDINDIYYETLRELLKDKYWTNRKVVLSGGGTVEKIDDVRYISNFSSGKMASSLALALYLKGAVVSLVSSRGYENLPKKINILDSQSSHSMYENLSSELKLAKKKKNTLKPYLFMVAAVSDYIPSNKEDGKLKKAILGNTWDLSLKQNIDILSSLDKKGFYTIGFKAEMDLDLASENAKNMCIEKDIDGVCLNILGENNSFGSNNNEIDLIIKNKTISFSGDKLDISFDILNSLSLEFYE